MEAAETLRLRPAVLPPHDALLDTPGACGEPALLPDAPDAEAEPITAFVCVIEYEAADGARSERLIRCQRLEVVGDQTYVRAYCNLARASRQFRVDRILCVSDAETGETLGDGCYFARFNTDTLKTSVESWGLAKNQKALLVAGLNVLSFMARCDGRWHPLEEERIEGFVCSLWMRKEWDGDPPIASILTHARRLAPDGETFFKSLNLFARSATSSRVLRTAVTALIEADGVVCKDEVEWTLAMTDHLADAGVYSGR